MNEKNDLIDKETKSNLRFLLCDPAGNYGDPASAGEGWVSSPIRCFDMAVDANPGLVAVRFGRMPIGERDVLLELSFATCYPSPRSKE